ncbi:Tn3 family transposase [Streptomyces sp. NPDC050997]|uniref:Tn3 family transposase n=1 Tax=Streptomyces sp. NPDC050997 TaxID=3155519 RepID=UPI00342853A0
MSLSSSGWTPVTDRLDKAHREFADGLAANPNVRIEQQGGRDRIILTGLDRLAEPDSLIDLNKEIEARIPAVDLPEIVLEVNSWVPYLSDFTHVSEANSRMDDLQLSVAAVLTSEATNVGIEPIVHDGVDALNRDRLFWVEQNYIRAQTLSTANARLVDYHMRLPLVQAWGGGELASADGLRFVTPIRTLNSGPNPKYFGFAAAIPSSRAASVTSSSAARSRTSSRSRIAGASSSSPVQNRATSAFRKPIVGSSLMGAHPGSAVHCPSKDLTAAPVFCSVPTRTPIRAAVNPRIARVRWTHGRPVGNRSFADRPPVRGVAGWGTAGDDVRRLASAGTGAGVRGVRWRYGRL